MKEYIYKKVNGIEVRGPRHAAALIIHAKIQGFNGEKTPKLSTIYRHIRKLPNGRYTLSLNVTATSICQFCDTKS